MKEKIIYLDSAATTWRKPSPVIAAVEDVLNKHSGNPGRGSHKISSAASEILFNCRETAAAFFHSKAENVIFTFNATHALNLAIKGLARDGCHILVDSFAHNAVYRPAMSLSNRGCSTEIFDALGNDMEILAEIRKKLRRNTGLVIATHQSNICSKILPIGEIGTLCAEKGIPFVVDASQSAGHLPIDVEQMKITALCMPGHKGLYGPMGCGMLISAPDAKYHTILEGGAGIHSVDLEMPDEIPERLEAGTLPLPAIAGLKAGMEWISGIGMERIRKHENKLSSICCRELSVCKGIRIIGPHDGNVISMGSETHSPAEIGEFLNQKGICVRTGYHCAPLAHRTLGTLDSGTVRLSFSFMNTAAEIYRLAQTMREYLF